MKLYEDLARIRVNDAIQYGLASQEAARALGKRRSSSWKTIVVAVGLVILVAIILGTSGMFAGI